MVSRLETELATAARLTALEAALRQMLRFGDYPSDIGIQMKASFDDETQSFRTALRGQGAAFRRRGHQQIDSLFRWPE